MKKILTMGLFLIQLIRTSTAQDYMFIHQKGNIITIIATEEIDSIIFYPAPGEDTITDIEGNVYNTVTIGTQIWMKENLKTTKYNDGTDIPLINDMTEWEDLTTPGYCWYENSKSIGKTYGALYNWYTVITGKLCPTGWHVPVDAEWTFLTNYLGGDSVAGGKLKESGTNHWESPNTGATNESGFTALPGGSRGLHGYFEYNIGQYGYWWSATKVGPFVWSRILNAFGADVNRSDLYETYGFSVRCIKD